MMNLAMTEKEPHIDSEVEDLIRKTRTAIADSEMVVARELAKQAILKQSLAGLEGIPPQEEPLKGVWSDMDVGVALETYLRGKENGTAERKVVVADLVMLGVKWDSKARGGAAGDINRAITYFLNNGRTEGARPLLIPEGTKIRLASL